MADFATLLRAGANQLSGLGALVNGRALGGPLLRQRVKLDAFVERRASYVCEGGVAEGLAEGGDHPDGALASAGRGGRSGGEPL